MVVVAVLLAGCLGGGGSVAPGTTTGDAPAGTAPTLSPGEGRVATVDRVIDGDTIVVTFENGTSETVRLLGVDTPEISTANDPEEYEGVPDTAAGRDCLDRWGERAHAVAIEALSGEQVRIVFDERSDRRGYYGRLLAYVYVDGASFNRRLVDEGYARVYESEFTELDDYRAAEDAAREAGSGLWTCASPETGETTGETASPSGLSVATIHADADGNDNENLNDEYVTFRNDGTDPLDLSGWTVEDGAGHVYEFPDGTVLDPGETVTLHTGSGTDTETDLYWGRGGAVWNNGGDTVLVRDADGDVVLRRTYGSRIRPSVDEPSGRRPSLSTPGSSARRHAFV